MSYTDMHFCSGMLFVKEATMQKEVSTVTTKGQLVQRHGHTTSSPVIAQRLVSIFAAYLAMLKADINQANNFRNEYKQMLSVRSRIDAASGSNAGYSDAARIRRIWKF